MNDNVFVYNLKLIYMKLKSKWNGPDVVKDISNHIYFTEMRTSMGKVDKWPPRARLTLPKKCPYWEF